MNLSLLLCRSDAWSWGVHTVGQAQVSVIMTPSAHVRIQESHSIHPAPPQANGHISVDANHLGWLGFR
jgi:hypothetical protein